MMSNQEPSSPLLRLADIRAWLPCVSQWQLRQLREAKLIKPVQVKHGSKRKGRGSGFYYRKSEIKAALGLDETGSR